jgi:hypothetical protein
VTHRPDAPDRDHGQPAVTAFTATKLLWVRCHARGHALQRSLALAAHGHGGNRSDGRWRHGIVGCARAGVGVTGARHIGHTPHPPAPDRPIDCTSRACLAHRSERNGVARRDDRRHRGRRSRVRRARLRRDRQRPPAHDAGDGRASVRRDHDPGHRPTGRVHALPHALADHWHILAAIPAAGLALVWAGRVLAVPREPGEPLSTEPPIFVPDVAGARTPLMDEQARGSFVGLALDHTARDLSFAAHEGVALRCARVSRRSMS